MHFKNNLKYYIDCLCVFEVEGGKFMCDRHNISQPVELRDQTELKAISKL